MGSEHGHQQVSTPPEEIKKLLAKAKVQVPSESPKFPSSISAGAAQISIEGRYRIDRARLGPNFTEADRQWRIKYIKSQDLHPNEPFEVPELERVHYNPIRRFYRVPMNLFENAISKIIGKEYAIFTRKLIAGTFIGYMGALFLYYQTFYNQASWETYSGIRIQNTREKVFPGDPRWPMADPKSESWQHYDRGFHDRKSNLSK